MTIHKEGESNVSLDKKGGGKERVNQKFKKREFDEREFWISDKVMITWSSRAYVNGIIDDDELEMRVIHISYNSGTGGNPIKLTKFM